MSYCPKCAVEGDEDRDGDVEWHRRCALVVLGALLARTTPSDTYRHVPKE